MAIKTILGLDGYEVDHFKVATPYAAGVTELKSAIAVNMHLNQIIEGDADGIPIYGIRGRKAEYSGSNPVSASDALDTASLMAVEDWTPMLRANISWYAAGIKKRPGESTCIYTRYVKTTGSRTTSRNNLATVEFGVWDTFFTKHLNALTGSKVVLGVRVKYVHPSPTAPDIAFIQRGSTFFNDIKIRNGVPVFLEFEWTRDTATSAKLKIYMNGVRVDDYAEAGGTYPVNAGSTSRLSISMDKLDSDKEVEGFEFQYSDIYISADALTDPEETKTGRLGPIKVMPMTLKEPVLNGDWFVTNSTGSNVRLNNVSIMDVLNEPTTFGYQAWYDAKTNLSRSAKYLISDETGATGEFTFEFPSGVEPSTILALQTCVVAQQPMTQTSKLVYKLTSDAGDVVPETTVAVISGANVTDRIQSPLITKKPNGGEFDRGFLDSLKYIVGGTKYV